MLGWQPWLPGKPAAPELITAGAVTGPQKDEWVVAPGILLEAELSLHL